MFTYNIVMHLNIDGKEFELHKTWCSPVQLRKGDQIYIDGLESVKVESVEWYLDKPGTAFVSIEDQHCNGPEIEWQSVLDQMDCVIPDLATE
jgi:hypothetical protein